LGGFASQIAMPVIIRSSASGRRKPAGGVASRQNRLNTHRPAYAGRSPRGTQIRDL
jgi:hypothetical protein